MPTTEHPHDDLLDRDGRAAFLTHFLASHRAFRRDAARFPVALRRVGTGRASGHVPDVDALRRHWGRYRGALAYHHHMEDELVFPRLPGIGPSLRDVVDTLVAEHHELAGAITAVDETLSLVPAVGAVEAAALACEDLAATLDAHFEVEEEHLVPVMRASAFEPSAGHADLPGRGRDAGDPQPDHDDGTHAFAMPWTADGLDATTVTALLDSLPPPAQAGFPRWQADYAERLNRWWW